MVLLRHVPGSPWRPLPLMAVALSISALSMIAGCGAEPYRSIDAGGSVHQAVYLGPRADRMAVVSSGNLGVVSSSGGLVRQHAIEADDPNFVLSASPDGSRILCLDHKRSSLSQSPNRATLCEMELATGQTRDIVASSGRVRSYLYDPRGKSIAVVASNQLGDFELRVVDRATGRATLLVTEKRGIINVIGWAQQANAIHYAVETDDRVTVLTCELGGKPHLLGSIKRSGPDAISGMPSIAGNGGLIYATGSGKLIVKSPPDSARSISLKKNGLSIHRVSPSHSGRYAAIQYCSDSNMCGVLFVDLTKSTVVDLSVQCKARMLPCIEFADWHPASDRALCIYKSKESGELREYDVADLLR